MTYFNTNKESGQTLEESIKKSKSQEERILIYLKKEERYDFTPDYLWENYFMKEGIPLTSIRRAVSNLCNKGITVKTKFMTDGGYGKQIHIYHLLDRQIKLF